MSKTFSEIASTFFLNYGSNIHSENGKIDCIPLRCMNSRIFKKAFTSYSEIIENAFLFIYSSHLCIIAGNGFDRFQASASVY